MSATSRNSHFHDHYSQQVDLHAICNRYMQKTLLSLKTHTFLKTLRGKVFNAQDDANLIIRQYAYFNLCSANFYCMAIQ